jgi:hypothetical protein
VREPVSLFLSVITPYGEHFTESVSLFEQKNTITVDLSTNEFSIDRVSYNQPIVGLSAVSAIRVYLVSSQSTAGEAVLDSLVVCASDDAQENVELAELINAPAAGAELVQVAFPDVESLSQALIGALTDVQKLSSEVADLRSTQHRVSRAFEQFSLRARTSLDTAVDALSSAMSSNVEQTLANAKLLERVRSSLADTAAKQTARIEQLERQFAALHSLGSVKPGESLAAAVQRTVRDEAAADAASHEQHTRKRAADAEHAQADIDAARAIAASKPTTLDVPDRFHVTPARHAKRSATPFVRAP